MQSSKKEMRQLEATLKAEIAAADKIADAGERLMQYKALQESCADLYDHGKVVKFGGNDREVLGGVALALPALVLVGATGVGFIFVTAAGIAGFAAGAKGAHLFGRSRAVRHANKMFEMEKDISSRLEKLASVKNTSKLAASPRAQDVARAFPEIAAEFKRIATKKKFVNGETPAAKPEKSKRIEP